MCGEREREGGRERTIGVKVKPKGERGRAEGERRVLFYLNNGAREGERRGEREREETAAFD